MSESPRVKCPECTGACRRLIGTGSGVIFKGSGFYETDYKTKCGKPDDSLPKKSSDEKKKDSSGAKTGSAKKESTPKKSSTKSDT
jgi:predicted nucleic acid-binding Zn ribbon protein